MFHQKLSYMSIYLYLALNERPQEAAAWADLVQGLQRNLNKLTNEEIFLHEDEKWSLILVDLGTKIGRLETIQQSITQPSSMYACLCECGYV